MTCSNSNTDGWFIEIESPETEEMLPDWIDCYIIENIDPTSCGPLSKDLSAILPLRRPTTKSEKSYTETNELSATHFPRMDHLKRTRKRAATENELKLRSNAQSQKLSSSSSSSSDDKTSCSTLKIEEIDSNDDKKKQSNGQRTKKRKQKEKKSNQNSIPWSLDVLVGSVDAVNDSLTTVTAATSQNVTSQLLEILTKYGLSYQSPNFTRQALPGRPAKTKKERDEWNKSLWPTLFFEKKTTQYKHEEMALSDAEVDFMKNGMREALSDAKVGNKQWIEWKEQIKPSFDKELSLSISGAVVVHPQTGSIVSRASQERTLQGIAGDAAATNHQIWTSFPDYTNPLSTAPLLAIQGVSRTERQVAISNGMESDEFRGGQYLCTGYDVYLTKEPNVFEAMSLVHSRVRRVVFGIPDEGMGGLGGPKSNSHDAGIHSLPGTNHHYRAFRLNLSDGSDGCSVDDVMTRKSLVAELHNLHPEDTS